ncbi:MAG: type IIL restriction-modification enzyme MmeI, partial [Paludibacteraceae bacterium]|nr:type IIL restriction-modification enzyme MmeI [Paludibacteraceae bacterium]
LENKIIARLQGGQAVIGEFVNPIKVDIHQFYGIEINDFAVSVATTALWIAELQMLRETRKVAHFSDTPLPLKTYHNIHEGNALRVDWAEVLAGGTGDAITGDAGVSPAGSSERTGSAYNAVSSKACALPAGGTPASPVSAMQTAGGTPASPVSQVALPSSLYIIGNPPFIGARMKSAEQAEDMLALFGKDWKNIGNLDYVGGWYLKAARLMQLNSAIRAALVSTNSITQGEQVAILWQPLFEQYGIHFDFAYPTFRWDSESSLKAHVHCVILGFSRTTEKMPRRLYRADGTYQACQNINGYLVDAPSVFINSRSKPLCDVPEIGIGNKPIDGGNYLFLPEEKEEFIRKEPKSASYFRPWYGSDEFINNRPRFCLWLGGCSPAELRSMPECLKRVENVRNFRLASKSEGTRKIADKPTHFHVENMPSGSYIIIPETSSERRRYVPMGFMTPDVLCSNAVRLIPNATLYHFGVLTSNVHMAWMRAVCGRLEMRYRYSKDIVYNNFPWPFNGGAVTGDAVTGGVPTVSRADSSGRTACVGNVVSSKACALPAGGTPASPVSPILDHCRKYLPHIENKQLQTITFRLYDSLPSEVLQQYKNMLVNADESSPYQQIRRLVEQYEDTGYGQCFLRDERVARIVQDALKFNHGKQYQLISWCIMPNHVHVLIEVLPGYSLSTILHTWRSFTAHEANKVLQRTGEFWMEEYYDRYVRDIDHFNNAVRYIESNPIKAGLVSCAGDYAYCSVGDGWHTSGAGVSPADSSGRTACVGNVVSSKAFALPAGGTPASPVITAGETPASPVAESAAVAKIMQTAQGILDARALYPDCSLADLYDEVTMPIELRRAHQANDRAVMEAYGFSTKMTESECVARLLEMYQALI